MANIEVARAYVTIVPSLQGAQKEIATQLDAETKDVGEKSGEKVGSGMSSGISSALKKGAKVVVGAVTAIATAAFTGVVALSKQAVSTYADFEQLSGGAELMFGDAYDFIVEKSQEAYATVQMSQNDYLQQVNGLAVGLKTALNGDAQAAAELADKVVTAEADVVAATGQSQEAVQNAFNGIMKGNYAMLDNLQIGINPTKEGFQEVIDKVNEWNEEQGKATNYQIDNLADCQAALVDYVEMVGMAGYAGKEGADTITGSLASTKAAWSNFVSSLASGDVDMLTKSLDGLTESLFGVEGEAGGLINNLLPTIETTLTSLVTVVTTKLPEVISRILPILTGALNNLLMSLGPMLPTLVTTLMTAINMLIPTVINLLVNSADTITALLMGVVQIITTLVTALSSGDNTARLVNGAVAIITTLVEGIAMNLPILIPAVVEIITQIITTLTSPENIEALLQAALLLLGALVVALAECIPVLIEGVVGLLTNIGDLFVDAVDWVADVLIPTLVNFWTTKVIPWLESVKEFFANIWTAIKAKISEIWNSIVSFFVSIFTNIKNNVTNNFNAVKDFITNVFNNIKNTITNIWNNIKSTITNTINNIKTSISNVFNNVKTNITNTFNAVKTTVTNIWNGIKTAITTPINSAKEAVQTAINKVKSILSGNLSFPSIKLPHFSISGSFSLAPPKVPKLSIDWYAKGYDQAQILNGAQIFGAMGSQMLAGGERGAEVVVGEQHLMDMIAQAKGGNITINVYASEGMNETTLAERVAEKLQQITESKEIVYA